MLLYTVVQPVFSQVHIPITDVVERLDDSDFFMHTVMSGQTYFSIANAYRIPLDRLREENPHSGDVLRAGSVLRIPVTTQNENLRTGSTRDHQDRIRSSRTEPGSEIPEGEFTLLETMQLEHRVDDILTRALNNHFDPAYYLLDVSIELSARFYMQEMPVPVIREQRRELDEQLPGLPFIPRDLLRDLGTEREVREITTSRMEVKVPEIDRIAITIRVDSIYGEEEIALMRQIVESKVQLDPDRGDVLEILQERLIRIVSEPKIDTAQPNHYFFLLFIVVIMLALLTGLVTWYIVATLRRRKGDPERNHGAALPAYGAAADSSPSNIPGGAIAQESNAFQASSGTEERPGTASSRNYLMQVFMRQPEHIGRLFTYWHEHDEVKGMRRAAAILQSIDHKILGLLHETMPPDAFRSLESAMRVPMYLPSLKADELLEQFAGYLQIRQQQTGDASGFAVLPSFDFLQFTDDEELFRILEPEPERVKALVLSHLSNPRKRKLLQEFGLEEASRIIFSLAKIRTIPLHEYEKIASRLFKQRHHAGYAETGITNRDVDHIVSVIEALPVSDHEKYIRQLDQLAPDLADAVRKRIITMERIAELDDRTLEPAVDALGRSELATALVGTEESIRTRLLQFRPKREEELIREEIENMVFLSRAEIDEARGKLLGLLKQIRKGEQEVEQDKSTMALLM